MSSIDTTELPKTISEAIEKYKESGGPEDIYIVAQSWLDEHLVACESHIIKAISHHFALPETDLIKAINDYKPMEEK